MTEARAALIMDYPFFGYLSLRLQLACAPCGTACTDGERLIFDPEFEKELKTDQEMQFVILHEILHCALGHCTRRGSRSAHLYNIACDTVVNSIILDMWGLGTLLVAGSEPVHLAPNGEEGRKYNAEEVYEMLLKQGPQSSPISNPKIQKASDNTAASPLDNHDIWDAIRDSTGIDNQWSRNILDASSLCSGRNGLCRRESGRRARRSCRRRRWRWGRWAQRGAPGLPAAPEARRGSETAIAAAARRGICFAASPSPHSCRTRGSTQW